MSGARVESSSPVIVIAPDSFKGSISAENAAKGIAAGVRRVLGDTVDIRQVPLADGGEGTIQALAAAWGVSTEAVETVDALRRPTTARFARSAEGKTAVIEAAEANGLPGVADVPLAPMRADTYGVGLIARHVLDLGVEEVILCIGGSASSDGGTGFMSALGVRFLDEKGRMVVPGAQGLAQVREIEVTGLDRRASEVHWRIAVDVENPLCGPRGAAKVFGPQKGASETQIAALDSGLSHLASLLGSNPDRPGFGAAGGFPLTVTASMNTELEPGSLLIAEAVRLKAALRGADLVIAGEGSLDSQSLDGKVVDRVLRDTPPGVPVVVIAGRVALSLEELHVWGVTAAFSIAAGPATLASLIETVDERLGEVAGNIVSAWATSCERRLVEGQSRAENC